MYKKSRVFAFLTTCPLMMAGCVNMPPKAEASVPLVHSSLSYSLKRGEHNAINVPELTSYEYSKGAAVITYIGKKYQSTKAYLSVSGNKCVRFNSIDKTSFAEQTSSVLTACQRNGEWSMIPSLVSNTEG